MNDCIWYMMGVCECPERCGKYVSINNEDGRKIESLYDDEINQAITPVTEKWRNYFVSNEWRTLING